MIEWLSKSNVGLGAVVSAVILGIWYTGYPSACLRQAEKLKNQAFCDCTFRVRALSYLWPVLFFLLGWFSAQAALDSIGGRKWFGLFVAFGFWSACILFISMYLRTVAEFRDGEFILREGKRVQRALLGKVREVKLGYGTIDVYHCDRWPIRVPNTLERLPTIIAMLKHYRPDAGS